MEDREILEALETIASHRRVYPKRTLVIGMGTLWTRWASSYPEIFIYSTSTPTETAT